MRALLLVLLGFSAWSSAFASLIIPNGTLGITPVTGGWQFNGGPQSGVFVGRNFAPGAGSFVSKATDVGKYALNGREVAVTVSRGITAAELAGAAVALGAAAYGGCAVGTAIASYAGIGTAGGSRTGCNVTDWLFDAGQPQVMTQVRSCADPFGQIIGTVVGDQGACVGMWTGWAGSHLGSRSIAYWTDGNSRAELKNADGSYAGYWQFSSGFPAGSELKCPAYIDPLNPAYSVPAGSPPGPDGKCATGRYAPITAEQMKEKLIAGGKPAFAPAFAQDVVTKGGSIPSAATPEVVSLTPTTITGDPIVSSTTKPDGTVETSTKTPTTVLSPSGDTVKESTTWQTVINSCVGTGACATTTTTTTTPKSATDTEQQKTDCDKYPDSLGCIKAGEASSIPLPERSIDISAAPDAGWGASSAACPAPRTVSVMGYSAVIDNSLLCSFFSGIRFAVIGAFGLAAVLIFIGGFKS